MRKFFNDIKVYQGGMMMFRALRTIACLTIVLVQTMGVETAIGLGSPVEFEVTRLHLAGQVKFVLPAELDGRPWPELVVGYISDEEKGPGRKQLAVFTCADGLSYDQEPVHIEPLASEIGTIDMADLNGDGLTDLLTTQEREMTIVFHNGRDLIPKATDKSLRLNHATVLPVSRTTFFRFRAIRDMTHDGRADLFLPTASGYDLFVQAPDATFSDRPTQTLRLDYGSSITEQGGYLHIGYSLPVAAQLDINGDATTDLAFSDGNCFHFFPFDTEKGLYGPPRQIRLPVAPVPFGRIHSIINDVDNDGLPDILIMRVAGKKILKNEIFLFRGRPGLVYQKKEDQLIFRKGAAEIPQVIDLNGNQKKELVATSIDVGLSLVVDYFIRNRIGIDVSVYRIGAQGIYEDKPIKGERIYLQTEEEEGSPSSAKGDFNGDSLEDFVLATSPDKLSFFGADRETLVSEKPICEVHVPSYGKVSVEDINGDGCHDLTITYPVEKRRGDLSVLISKCKSLD